MLIKALTSIPKKASIKVLTCMSKTALFSLLASTLNRGWEQGAYLE